MEFILRALQSRNTSQRIMTAICSLWSPSAVAADESFLASPFAWVGEGAAGAEAEAVGGAVWMLRQQQAAELPDLGRRTCAPRRIACEAS